MGTVRAGEQNIRVLHKNNTGTYLVSIPVEIVRLLKWRHGHKLSLKRERNTIVIKDMEPTKR